MSHFLLRLKVQSHCPKLGVTMDSKKSMTSQTRQIIFMMTTIVMTEMLLPRTDHLVRTRFVSSSMTSFNRPKAEGVTSRTMPVRSTKVLELADKH